MNYYIGFTVSKVGVLNSHIYADMAVWCNENNAHIEERDGEYIIIQNPEPSAEDEARSRISTLKDFLTSTDYVITKLAEYSLLGKDTSVIATEYADTLSERDNARIEINEIYQTHPRLAIEV